MTTIVVLLTGENNHFMMYVRYILGTAMVLFFPGFSFTMVVFPKKMANLQKMDDEEKIECIALIIVTSLALVTLIAFILHYSPWGIQLSSIISSLSILVVLLSSLSVFRKYRISQMDQPK